MRRLFELRTPSVSVQLVVCFQKFSHICEHFFSAARGVALEIQNENRVMHAHAQQEPSVAVIFVSIYSDALVVYLLRLPAVALFGERFQVGYNFFAVGFEIFKVYLEPAFKLLRRLFKVGDKALEAAAALFEQSRFYYQLRNEIRAVVEIVILPECGMAGGLNRKRAVDALFIEFYLLVDNILIAALKSDMLAAMRLDEFRKSR